MTRLKTPRRTIAIATFICGTILLAQCQTLAQENPPSLGDAARRARQEREHQSNPQSDVQRLAQSLEESQNVGNDAPQGFKYVREPGLPYAVLVPVAAELDGRDSNGARWTSPAAIGAGATVFLGPELGTIGSTDENKFSNAMRQYLGMACRFAGATVAGGVKVVLIDIDRSCGWGRFGQFGTIAMFLKGNSVFPIVCAFPTTAADYETRTHWDYNPKRENDRRGELIGGLNACDTILKNVAWVDDSKYVQPLRKGPRQVVIPDALRDNENERQWRSAAEIARATSKGNDVKAAKIFDGSSIAGPELTELRMPYCNSNLYTCFTGVLQVPKQAQIAEDSATFSVTTTISEFKSTLKARRAKMMPRLGWMSDLQYARDLIAAAEVRDYTSDQIDNSITQVGDYFAVVLQHRIEGPVGAEMEVRALVAAPGATFDLTCRAPENQFPSFEPYCTRFIRSLKVEQ